MSDDLTRDATAPKDGTRVLLQLKNPVPRDWEEARRWDGVPFVGRHSFPTHKPTQVVDLGSSPKVKRDAWVCYGGG